MAVRLIAGTDVTGEAEPIWEAPDGVERALRAALAKGLKHVCIVGGFETGELYVASTMASAEATIGMLLRGQMHIHESASAEAVEASEPLGS